MENVVYTVLAILLVCQIFSFSLHWSHSPRQVNRAFEQLEMDFENLTDHVASQLGRISRLKRATVDASRTQDQEELAAPGSPGFSLTPRQKQLQASILARRGEREAKPS